MYQITSIISIVTNVRLWKRDNNVTSVEGFSRETRSTMKNTTSIISKKKGRNY